ncbi:MAG: putative Peroxiredoxin OsmC [Bacteroidetes bacterium]|nr:putative Peroxiredoxin OsmC [Bacteroidota bacterium]
MQSAPATRYKTFEFTTATTWSAGRQGSVSSPGKPELTVASPPEFRGVPGVWTPEDFYVAAIESCQMTTFLALAARSGLALKRYASSARGRLEFQDGGYRFTAVDINVRVGVLSEDDARTARDLVDQAHHSCLIGRSALASITVHPDITVEP